MPAQNSGRKIGVCLRRPDFVLVQFSCTVVFSVRSYTVAYLVVICALFSTINGRKYTIQTYKIK